MVSGIIGNDVPRKGLRVRSPCPPLRPLAVGRFRLAMYRLLTDRPYIVFLDARTQRSGTQCNGTQCNGTQCNGTRTRWLFKLRRCRSMIEAVRGNLKTNGPDRYIRSSTKRRTNGAKWQVPGKRAPFRLTVSRRRTGLIAIVDCQYAYG